MTKPNAHRLAESLLLAVKQEEPFEPLAQQLASLSLQAIRQSLESDPSKIAFWINVYNAYFQILRKHYDLRPPRIYRKREIVIAGQRFSLDDIEHGILRRYRWKYFQGYLPNVFASRTIRSLAVAKVDWRIHFALNCGAKSCPPIAFYSPDKLDQQLDWATLAYLKSETEIDAAAKEIRLTPLFHWFAADFGGSTGVRQILAERLQIDTQGYRLKYKPWLRDEALAAFVDRTTAIGEN